MRCVFNSVSSRLLTLMLYILSVYCNTNNNNRAFYFVVIGNMLRFLGLLCLLTIFILSGYNKITNTKDNAAYLSKSNFPTIVASALQAAGLKYKLTSADYELIIQATGGIFVAFSSFILLGVGRRFFAFLLAAGLVFVTVCFHVDLKKPAATPVDQQIQCLKNLAIIGGLLIVAGTSRRIVKVESSPAASKAKKAQ